MPQLKFKILYYRLSNFNFNRAQMSFPIVVF